jgi:hypothetical protein
MHAKSRRRDKPGDDDSNILTDFRNASFTTCRESRALQARR